MTDQPVYRVGVIGGGRQGTIHARAYHLHPRTELVAVADNDAENLELFCKRFDVHGYADYHEMLDKEGLDISAPVLPVKANPDAVVASAEAGVKAVFSEKPLAGSLVDADRMVEACASRGIPFAAGLVVSSHPEYNKAYRLAAEGAIGEVLRINLTDPNGQVGTHGLNLIRKFANKSEVDFVVGFVEGDPHATQEDDFGDGKGEGYGKVGGYVKFKNGIECFSTYTGPGFRGIEVVGTRGLMFNSNNTGLGIQMWKVADGVDPKKNWELTQVEGVFAPRPPGGQEYDEEGWRKPGEILMLSIDALVEAMDTGKPPELTTGDDLRHSLGIAVALRESARKGSVPVKLPIEDRSIEMYPQRGRWNYKKDVHGVEWYREAMKIHVRE